MKGKRAAPGGVEPDAFPGLDADLETGGDDCAGATKRVCIATPATAASAGDEDIGLACRHLACLLAGQGHAVVVAQVGGAPADERLTGEVRERGAASGIVWEPLPVPRSALAKARTRAPAPAWTFFDWLRECEPPFDVVHVPDWHGVGYGALLAKSLGLAFGATHFVVHGHAPLLWNAEGNRRFLTTQEELGWVFMERRSAELADTLVCRSAHLLQWMREAGYDLPARSFVWPDPFPAPVRPPEAVAARAERDGARLEEVVFFGRLEPRQGLDLFLRAIDRLARRGRAPGRIVFLDRRPGRSDVPEPVRDAARRWPAEVRTITGRGFEEATAYLSRPGRLALMPSRPESSPMAVAACLQEGIPFVAAATGGTPELVAPASRARVLVAPDHVALGERIAELAGAPLRAALPRRGFERVREVWSRWHARAAPFEAAARRFAERARAAGSETPLVTVCVVHHERPELVRMAVDSVRAQDWPALEAVLVDDGSESAAAQAALDAIEADFGTRGWRVIRQENRYLGAARNAAAAVARGEWLLFLDDDDVLFPDAVSRLVRAARFSGADCVPAARVHFSGDGDPGTGARPPGTLVRFIGAARGWCRFINVAGGACALVRRAAFEAVGGFTEDYGVALEDLEFFNRLDRAGFRIEPLPDPAYWYREQPISMTRLLSEAHSAEASRVRALSPYFAGWPGEERAFALHALFQFHDAPATIRDLTLVSLRVLSARIGRLRRLSRLRFPKRTSRDAKRRHLK